MFKQIIKTITIITKKYSHSKQIKNKISIKKVLNKNWLQIFLLNQTKIIRLKLLIRR